MKKIGIVSKLDEKARKKTKELERWLRSRDIEVVVKENPPFVRNWSGKRYDLAPPDLFCVFVLGGDGTFLSAVRWIGDSNIPILGIKFGEVGFLAEISEDRLFPAVETVLKNEFSTFRRMRLQVRVVRNGKEIVRETVLNDIVINKGALARLASIETHIDGVYLTTFRADGLIVSTPTGSTAYSLAAGGPVVHPEVRGIIMTPICPFTLTNRPLIVQDSAIVRIRLADEENEDIMLTFDGQSGLEISDKDMIFMEKSPHPIRMIMMPDSNYFEILKAKLRWSGGRV